MAAASNYRDELSPPTKPGFTHEMQNLHSPDPSYNRPFLSPQQQTSDPYGYEPNASIPPTPNPDDGRFSRLASRKFEKFKRWVRILQVVAQVVTTLFSAIMFAIMIYVNIKHYSTKGTIREGRNPWPKDGTKVWPAIMLLAASGVTLLLSVATILSYCCCWKKARASWKLTVVQYVIHIVGWIIVAVVYRYEKSLHGKDNDLWGWSCSTKAADIQTLFDGVVDFSALCRQQSNSWYISLATFAAKLLFAIGHYVLNRKVQGEKQGLADRVGDAGLGLVTDVF